MPLATTRALLSRIQPVASIPDGCIVEKQQVPADGALWI
jgi:hypothetical protein